MRRAEQGRASATARWTRPSGDRLRRDRHRHRHPARQAAAHLRGVPAGRRHHQPQVRRHRPGPLDQPRDRPPARRRDPRGEHAGARAAPSRCSCRGTTSARRSAARGPAPTRRAAARGAPTAAHAGDAALGRRRDVGARPDASRGRSCGDDRERIDDGDRVLLVIIENDADFAGVLLEMAREHGFKGPRGAGRRGGAAAGPRVPARRRSRSTWTCRGSTAGRCSTG